MPADDWYRLWRRRFGDFPRSYLVLDTETTGLDVYSDLPLQIGYLKVCQGCVESKGARLVNWFSCSYVRPDWLDSRMSQARAGLEAAGKHYPFSRELLEREGYPPHETLDAFLSFCRRHSSSGGVFVGHNFLRFDRRLLESVFRKYLSDPWRFPENSIYDTGLISKAKLLGEAPGTTETLEGFQQRISRIRMPPGQSWSLEACAKRLPEKERVKVAEMHDAVYDCFVAHRILEAHRT